MTRLSEVLSRAAGGRGVAALAVIERAGGTPRACWVPESEHEPAFLAYSITKTFTAALILRLCELGRLDLEARIFEWFPRVAHSDRISLRQLLNHTSGIRDYGGLPAYHADVRSAPSSPWSFERFAAETFEKELLFEPGHGWAYSNPGYMLLKRVAEVVTGSSYGQLVAELITAPLGLGRTFVAETIEDLATIAPGSSCELSPDGSPRDVRTHYHPGWVSHGVIASTASDITRFFDGLFRGELVSVQSLGQMTDFVDVRSEPADEAVEHDERSRHVRPSYGLGLMGDPASPWGPIAGHNGGGPCYSASAFHAFDLDGASVCAMGAIEEGFDAEGVVFDVFDHLKLEHPLSS